MSTTEAREAILARIRDALADQPDRVAVPRTYRVAGAGAGAGAGHGAGGAGGGRDVVALFAERVADYRATVREVSEANLPAVITEALAAIPARRVVVPVGVPSAWLDGTAAECLSDEPPLDHHALDAVDVVITTCAIAIAETGTIVLDGGPGQGRRALSLLPDHHVCVVRAEQIVPDVPDALPRLEPRRPMTWISGPSATSDIELRRVEGVHGPRNLIVLIVTR